MLKSQIYIFLVLNLNWDSTESYQDFRMEFFSMTVEQKFPMP